MILWSLTAKDYMISSTISTVSMLEIIMPMCLLVTAGPSCLVAAPIDLQILKFPPHYSKDAPLDQYFELEKRSRSCQDGEGCKPTRGALTCHVETGLSYSQLYIYVYILGKALLDLSALNREGWIR